MMNRESSEMCLAFGRGIWMETFEAVTSGLFRNCIGFYAVYHFNRDRSQIGNLLVEKASSVTNDYVFGQQSRWLKFRDSN